MKKTIISVFVIAIALTFIAPIPVEAKTKSTTSYSTTKSTSKSKSKSSTKSKSSSKSSSKSRKKTYDSYDADKYSSPDDFAEDKYEEFYDYEDAEDDDDAYDAAVDYWNSKNKSKKKYR